MMTHPDARIERARLAKWREAWLVGCSHADCDAYAQEAAEHEARRIAQGKDGRA